MKDDNMRYCSIEGCDKKYSAKGFCKYHYHKDYCKKHEKYLKEYEKTPKRTDKWKKYYQRPEVKAHRKEYEKTPERMERRKKHRIEKYFKITLEEYDEKIKNGCVICGFKTIVDLHHINGRHDNTNLVALCPNHHRALHFKNISFERLSKIK